MDDIQFVHESPQLVQGQKKRPRLVTSCDNCRLKKVRCIQPPNSTKCEACETAQVSCRYRDRERYFAERSRITSNSSPDRTQSRTPSRSNSLAPSTSTKREDTPPSLYQLGWAASTGGDVGHTAPFSVPHHGVHQPTASHSGVGYRPASSSHSSGNQWQGLDSSSYYPQHQGAVYPDHNSYTSGPQKQKQTQTPLFDPNQPDRPHPTLLAHFIQLFFSNLTTFFPFLNHDTTTRQFYDQTLSSLVANCIAALAARFSDKSDITERGVGNVQDAYCSHAESLLVGAIKRPSLEVLHALTLLAWFEYKRGHSAAFCTYTQMALQVAVNLGLSDGRAVRMCRSELERNILQSTWACVTQLRLTAESFQASQQPHP